MMLDMLRFWDLLSVITIVAHGRYAG